MSAPGITPVGGQFFPGADRLLLFGSEAGGARCYVLPLAGGVPRPLGPATAVLPPRQLDRAVIAGDGQSVLLGTRDGWWRVAVDDDETRTVPVGRLARDERVLRFREDGKAVFTKREEGDAIVIEAVELETGHRQLVRRLPLGEGAFASARLHPVRITPDGTTIVYSVYGSTSELYLVEGLQ